jgi:hypothetical protein
MLVNAPGDSARAKRALGLLDLNRGDHDQGLEALSDAVDLVRRAGAGILAADTARYLCLHAFRLGRYERARAACRMSRQLCQGSLNPDDMRRGTIVATLERIAAARLLDEPARTRALEGLRSTIEELPLDLPERTQVALIWRYAAEDWVGAVELFREIEGRPDAVDVAPYAADALEHLGRQEEARRIDRWFAAHPDAWRHPNLRVRLQPQRVTTAWARPRRWC